MAKRTKGHRKRFRSLTILGAELQQVERSRIALLEAIRDATTRLLDEEPSRAPRKKRRGQLSAVGRANIIAAQRKRWARVKSK